MYKYGLVLSMSRLVHKLSSPQVDWPRVGLLALSSNPIANDFINF